MYQIPAYKNRQEAGKYLGEYLKAKHYPDPIVLGLPRGGVILAKEVAVKLATTFNVVISRKIGAPDHPEFGIGAVSEDERPIFSHNQFYDLTSYKVGMTVQDEIHELQRRIQLYRSGNRLPSMKDRIVIVVDDGLATGVTAIAAGKFLRSLKPEKLILAVPISPDDYPRELNWIFDEIVCPLYLENMMSVGMAYADFPQVEDSEVTSILKDNHI